ncbi:hypothetical protein PACTADRAFT_50814 [Pachysolen tannophilus NRRL Y-2460]|uniref:Uncharacterized protein n=1 Tax=Pachysolen tannophilus NRRL Y-2460 TaxID=669874 RepID=A0A1E4TTB4_PACTA|nr:hypothetical protein PACTADRAFT_50814 [Pachysolen tannophilus NRRL Y-2460]
MTATTPTIFHLNSTLKAPLKFYELYYIENFLNNPAWVNKNYFDILDYFNSHSFNLSRSMEELEIILRFMILNELHEDDDLMDVDQSASTRGKELKKSHCIKDVPLIPIYINNNFKKFLSNRLIVVNDHNERIVNIEYLTIEASKKFGINNYSVLQNEVKKFLVEIELENKFDTLSI